ncbi:hypothetical protein SUGI_0895410 [Cryptomeria japonica]|nr:hypothetical protein SUGI_0895410 [Cryptomeria japonica]
MRNIRSSPTHSLWRSPVPYLMAGMGVMIALILFALILLLWSKRNQNSGAQESESTSEKNEMEEKNMDGHGGDEMERVAVIMAGNDNPTFIAKPSSIAVPAV